MISQRKVEKEYNKLLERVETDILNNDNLINRVNCYKCDCGHIMKTKDVDAGVSPFKIACEKCGGVSTSMMYQKDLLPNKEPTIEWYRPSLKETMKLRKNEGLLEHVLNGGLLNRNVTPANTNTFPYWLSKLRMIALESGINKKDSDLSMTFDEISSVFAEETFKHDYDMGYTPQQAFDTEMENWK